MPPAGRGKRIETTYVEGMTFDCLDTKKRRTISTTKAMLLSICALWASRQTRRMSQDA